MLKTMTKTTTHGSLSCSLALAAEIKAHAKTIAWDDAAELTRLVEFGVAWDADTGRCIAEHGIKPSGFLWTPDAGVTMDDGEPLTYARALVMPQRAIADAIREMVADLADVDRDED